MHWKFTSHPFNGWRRNYKVPVRCVEKALHFLWANSSLFGQAGTVHSGGLSGNFPSSAPLSSFCSWQGSPWHQPPHHSSDGAAESPFFMTAEFSFRSVREWENSRRQQSVWFPSSCSDFGPSAKASHFFRRLPTRSIASPIVLHRLAWAFGMSIPN